jgi:hypothetical protein
MIDKYPPPDIAKIIVHLSYIQNLYNSRFNWEERVVRPRFGGSGRRRRWGVDRHTVIQIARVLTAIFRLAPLDSLRPAETPRRRRRGGDGDGAGRPKKRADPMGHYVWANLIVLGGTVAVAIN